VVDSNRDGDWLADLPRFIQHFPLRSQDVSLVVFNGHLLTEELLRDFLRSKVRHPSHLSDARLTYAQCVHLARALSTDSNDWVWAALEKLNVIRNKLSHALEPGNLEDSVNQFLDFVHSHVPKEPSLELRELFIPVGVATFSVHAALSGQLRIKPRTLLGSLRIPSNPPVQPTAEDGSG